MHDPLVHKEQKILSKKMQSVFLILGGRRGSSLTSFDLAVLFATGSFILDKFPECIAFLPRPGALLSSMPA